MDDSQVQHLHELKRIHQKRLQVLEVQVAKFGSTASPPHLLIELEELQEKITYIETQLASLDSNKNISTLNEQVISVNLRHNIEKHFNIEELRTLCFDLGIDSEDFPSLKQGFSRELISYCIRHGIISRLVNYCKLKRPHASW